MSIQRNSVSLLARGSAVLAGVVVLAGCQAAGSSAASADPATDASTVVATSPAGDGGTTADRADSATESANADAVSKLIAAAFPDPTSEAAQSAVGAKAVVKHIGADGDLVAVHWQITADPDDERTGEAALDVFRLAPNGQVSEHWSFDQPVPQGTPASGNTNTMFSDLYQGSAGKPAPTEQQEEANRQLAVGAYDTLFKDHDPSVLDRSFDPAYLQHNTVAANGTAALKAFFSGGAQFPAQQAVVSISDGDLVWILSQPVGAKADDPYLAADVFRVDGGLIREHWDVVPAS
jgi:predicted SnoaL-like aldol condensation-catalyzing enzyme